MSYKVWIGDSKCWKLDPRRDILEMKVEDLGLIVSTDGFAEGETAEIVEFKNTWFPRNLRGLDDDHL